MKNLLHTIVLVACATSLFTACQKEDNNNNGKLDPNALISIRPAPGVKATGNTKYLSAHEIVKQTSSFCFIRPNGDETGRGFASHQRDTINNRLLMYGTDVIDQFGELYTAFIEASNYIFVTRGERLAIIDTIAYIPNSVMRKAESSITEAYRKGDYATCYKIMDSAFIFYPITGEEWLELKKDNKQ